MPTTVRPCAPKAILQRAEPRREHTARAAPRRPEVEQDDASLQLTRSTTARPDERVTFVHAGAGAPDEMHPQELVARRTRREDDGGADRRSRPLEAERDRVADFVRRDRARDVAGAVTRAPSMRDDAVARANAAAFGGRAADDVLDANARCRRRCPSTRRATAIVRSGGQPDRAAGGAPRAEPRRRASRAPPSTKTPRAKAGNHELAHQRRIDEV